MKDQCSLQNTPRGIIRKLLYRIKELKENQKKRIKENIRQNKKIWNMMIH